MSEIPGMEEGSPILAISASIILVCALPLYLYGGLNFYKHRMHLFIKKRFPLSSITIIAASLLNGIIHCVLLWLKIITKSVYIPQEISGSFSFFVYGLVNMRLGRVYFRWKHQKYSSSDPVPRMWIYCNIIFNSFAFICLSIPVRTFGLAIAQMVPSVGWTIHITISVVLFIIIKCKKVEDGIGCLRETLSILCFMIFVSLMFSVTLISSYLAVPFMIFANIGIFIQGLIPLFYSLHYVRKLEGKSNENLMIEIAQNTGSISLTKFLEKHTNYQVFREYLSYCWALENLLFLERVSVLNMVIAKCANATIADGGTCGKQSKSPLRIEFKYSNIYKEYEVVRCDNTQQILQAQREIYSNFVKIGSANEVNISSQARYRLEYALTNETTALSMNDIIHVYDEALMEVHQLLVSMYGYEFKQYIKKHTN